MSNYEYAYVIKGLKTPKWEKCNQTHNVVMLTEEAPCPAPQPHCTLFQALTGDVDL